MVDFILISLPRSGTSITTHCLNQHPRIRCQYEIFVKHVYDKHKQQLNTTNPLDTLNKLINHDKGIFGFKYLSSNEEKEFMYSYVKTNKPKIIFLKRNYLETYVSHRISCTAKVWELGTPTGQPNIDFDVKEFITFANWFTNWFTNWTLLCIDNNIPFITVDYKDIISNIGFKRIFEFLNVDNTFLPEFKHLKQNRTPNFSQVNNYYEFYENINKTIYKDLLHSF